jgi:hypothetical protein
MRIDRISSENLVNLRSVTIDPAGPIEIGPGEQQTIKISFQVLVLEPYSFDLSWEHDASNPSPYRLTVQGDAKLNLGEYSVSQRMYDFIVKVINTGIFIKYPNLVLVFTRDL